MSKFQSKVLAFICSVPKGYVVSYGQVAACCGKPNGAREVGRILSGIDISKNKIPWWRVVNNQGFISIKGNWTAGKDLQKKLLEKEGLNVLPNYSLDINKYRLKGSGRLVNKPKRV